MSEDTIPTWGYKAGAAKLFELKAGEKLPDGWTDAPVSEEADAEKQPKKRKVKAEEPADGDSDGN